jgi:hypothetical protein
MYAAIFDSGKSAGVGGPLSQQELCVLCVCTIFAGFGMGGVNLD